MSQAKRSTNSRSRSARPSLRLASMASRRQPSSPICGPRRREFGPRDLDPNPDRIGAKPFRDPLLDALGVSNRRRADHRQDALAGLGDLRRGLDQPDRRRAAVAQQHHHRAGGVRGYPGRAETGPAPSRSRTTSGIPPENRRRSVGSARRRRQDRARSRRRRHSPKRPARFRTSTLPRAVSRPRRDRAGLARPRSADAARSVRR